ncbi:uncharacterized protein EV420DRAFT_1525012 [Desarmillaria tabescens]|uniref:Uncharacterized protein n=1 Tax=Armillaria tabescens TaxID=1929756 RepID=A0AA39T3T9_ARMTA|nr:uncharacterized protein EV420DRAFT_1525012 [Desarmillaria tabescens]KAK0462476.1 hypothetical protein EV420DRAFT_1525012 [Desarmillaria tabescens]
MHSLRIMALPLVFTSPLQFWTLLSTLVLFLPNVYSYVPAWATNSTQDAISSGLNVTDPSTLHLQWYNNGSYMDTVSYTLVGRNSTGVSEGALEHFSESSVSEDTPGTETPWIALISCDFNTTNASQEIDIFTLARDKGALSALLYSVYSSACVIAPSYSNSKTSDPPLDIFSTQSLTSSLLVENQFRQIGPTNGTYDSQMLNDSAAIIKEALSSGSGTLPTFLFATLEAYNAASTNGSHSGSANGKQGSPATTIGNGSGSSNALRRSLPSMFTAIACILFEGVYFH